MATATQVHLVPEDTGLWKAAQTDEGAKKATELLQQDLKEHHCFFNQDGFHNHIPHHLLTLFGTGASSAVLQKGYDGNVSYQRHSMQGHDRVPEELRDWDHAKQYLGDEKYYPDFLVFFQREIERLGGWEAAMTEYVFKGDERAEDMMIRLFSGFLHPIIQLMFGMEWKQPAIVAEALAQASVHGADLRDFLLTAESMAVEAQEPMPPIVSLVDAVRADEKLIRSPQMKDSNKVRDGVLARARDEMLAIAARVHVRPDELDEKTVEMFNACVYMGAASVFHPPKPVKFDFFLMHHINASPIFLTINAQPWIPAAAKVRLLEWKIRLDLTQYAARAAPPISVDAVASYRPRDGGGSISTPQASLARLHHFDDDGHAIKLARAAAICQVVSRPYEDRPWMRIKGEDLWMQIHHIVVDSVRAPGANYVRTAGLDEAWAGFEDEKTT